MSLSLVCTDAITASLGAALHFYVQRSPHVPDSRDCAKGNYSGQNYNVLLCYGSLGTGLPAEKGSL